MVVDAGGGTIDTSAYEITSNDPITLKEVAASDCMSSASFVASC